MTKRRKSVQKRVQKLKNPPPGQPTWATAKKDVANQKIEVKKLKNTRFFHFSLADFWRARSRTGVIRTVFYSVFWRRASRPIKNRRFWPKNAPPPVKPVTFSSAIWMITPSAPSVRAGFCFLDLFFFLFLFVFGFLPGKKKKKTHNKSKKTNRKNKINAWTSPFLVFFLLFVFPFFLFSFYFAFVFFGFCWFAFWFFLFPR